MSKRNFQGSKKRKFEAFSKEKTDGISTDNYNIADKKPGAFRRNNQVIEDSDFNFGTDDQRAEKQTYVGDQVCSVIFKSYIIHFGL